MKRVMLVALLVVSGAAFAGKSDARRADEALAAADKELILAAMGMVRWGLTDPESAHFRAVFISPGGKAVCGEVNSKNAMGGYVGFKRFIAARDKVGVEQDKTAFVERNWVARCLSDGDPVG
jgi:hypothetical protein